MNLGAIILLAVAAYAAAGVAFGIAFVTTGVSRVDPVARGAPWSFRVLILPGAAALWPIMGLKWIRAGRNPERAGEEHS